MCSGGKGRLPGTANSSSLREQFNSVKTKIILGGEEGTRAASHVPSWLLKQSCFPNQFILNCAGEVYRYNYLYGSALEERGTFEAANILKSGAS